MYVGVRGGIRTHGPRIHTTSAFTAAMQHMAFVVWTVPSPWTACGRQVLPIQSLHLTGRSRSWLGIGTAANCQSVPRI